MYKLGLPFMADPANRRLSGGMNEQLQRFARDSLKSGLAQLPEGSQLLFKRMYVPWALGIINERRKLTDEELATPINEVIDKMPEDKLDWAMQQVERTLQKNELAGGIETR
jgi:hypothetical protein